MILGGSLSGSSLYRGLTEHVAASSIKSIWHYAVGPIDILVGLHKRTDISLLHATGSESDGLERV